jgi:energy-coupling factor transporter ATP-binding protein EcfA2
MTNTTVYLFIGPKGSGKSRIIDHLHKTKKDEKNIIVLQTSVAPPIDMVEEFEKNQHYITMKHSEFRVRAEERSFGFVWKEFNEKQLAFDTQQQLDNKKKQDESHNMVFKGLSKHDIETAIVSKKDLVLNLSNSFLFKTKENLYIDNDKDDRFNLLREAINKFKDTCTVKVSRLF